MALVPYSDDARALDATIARKEQEVQGLAARAPADPAVMASLIALSAEVGRLRSERTAAPPPLATTRNHHKNKTLLLLLLLLVSRVSLSERKPDRNL